MSVEDFNNGLIMGLSLQGTMFVDKGSDGGEGGLINQIKYTTNWPVPPFDKPYEILKPRDNLSIGYSYYIT